ncbi:protein C-mannosyl-transferase DPY19L1 [Epargyreus clarus]|uniref:protein C-mannosyl-transferase DPY19L1 n=1 Tax=Epargyreus clarus TaxID=520877 RepID=UPI003C2EA9A5
MNENTEESGTECKPRKVFFERIVRGTVIVTLALSLGYIHYRYVSNLFENNISFSYLSDLEREMSLRTEMGFYYSYYKTVVEEKQFIAGITKLMYDKLVEYPHEVNALNRFNVYPEVIIAAVYRYLTPWVNNATHLECHMVNRGDGRSPVESCVGLAHPMFFYLEAVWWLAGLTVAALFLHAAVLSGSIIGGLVAALQYFANHAECTRVQWAPNERENLALPLLLLQAWLLTGRLRTRAGGVQMQVPIFVLNCLCLLFWQFSQFIFLTQTAIFFVMEQLKIIDIKALSIFLHSHFCGLHTAVLLLQGNDMLKSSLYTSFFLVVSAYCLFFSSFRIKIQNRTDLYIETWLVLLRILIVIAASLYLKKLISDFLEVQDDAHVWAILQSKFTDYKTFHTLIYTCSEVFDFLPLSSIKNMCYSFLIPLVCLSVFNVVTFWIKSVKCKKEKEDPAVELKREEDEDSGIENIETKVRKRKPKSDLDTKELEVKLDEDKLVSFLTGLKVEPAIFYSISQLAVYGVMALLVMRLKLLFATQMCLVSALAFNKNYYSFSKSSRWNRFFPIIWCILILPIIPALIRNVMSEMAHVGEFNDYPQEELLEWISERAGVGAFAGSMPLSATVLLATRRPIIIHPHYENQEARQRAYSVYKVYGKFTSQEVYQELSRLRATFLIVESKYCYGKSLTGCTFENIWDAEVPALRSNPVLCRSLLTTPVDHFYPVFRNQHYAVFRIHDISVRYMPRAFDT